MSTCEAWTCRFCNLHNKGTRNVCQACFKARGTRRTALYAIGDNYAAKLGAIGDVSGYGAMTVNMLTKLGSFHEHQIEHIYCSLNNTIFATKHHEFLFVCGANYAGQCAYDDREQFPASSDHQKFDDAEQSNPAELHEISYFKSRDIQIRKICTNVAADYFFVITESHGIYAFGSNRASQLGLGVNAGSNIYTPTRLRYMDKYRVKDIACGEDRALLLALPRICECTEQIVYYFSRECELMGVPSGVVELITLFLRENTLFSTVVPQATEYGKFLPLEMWKDTFIVKVAAGRFHALLLDSHGTVWSVGRNAFGELGNGEWGYGAETITPEPIDYFEANKIKIVDIQCGAEHNLALDDDGKVYGWGRNDCWQCGFEGDIVDLVGFENVLRSEAGSVLNALNTPLLVRDLDNFVITEIKCGAFHSMAKNDQNEYFLFGENRYWQCSMYGEHGGPSGKMITPDMQRVVMINDRAEVYMADDSELLDVYLGNCCTFIKTSKKPSTAK